MATPNSLKSAISIVKSSLSPRNPNFLDLPSPKHLVSPRKHIRHPVSRKCLNYTQSQSNHLNVFDIRNPSVFFDVKPTAERKKQSIIINTPTKADLMQNGLSTKERILDILGRGSFGTVVKGSFKNKLVAVKITRENKNNQVPSDINAKGLSHENIVKVLDVIMRPQSEYAIIIMEYLEGAKNLQLTLESCELDKIIKKKYIEQICLGLQYCHAKGILHLDVKPKNILVLPSNQCKLCDFGNSCTIEGSTTYLYQGTPAYAAPELLRGMKPTEKSDIYSLGITIWQIEYRKSPYESWENSKCLVYNVVKNNARPVYEKRNDSLTTIFVNCWHQNPSERPELTEILEML